MRYPDRQVINKNVKSGMKIQFLKLFIEVFDWRSHKRFLNDIQQLNQRRS